MVTTSWVPTEVETDNENINRLIYRGIRNGNNIRIEQSSMDFPILKKMPKAPEEGFPQKYVQEYPDSYHILDSYNYTQNVWFYIWHLTLSICLFQNTNFTVQEIEPGTSGCILYICLLPTPSR